MSEKPADLPPSLSGYMLRAVWQWIVDQNHIPQILVNARLPGVNVPKHAITPEGMITLNVSINSTKFLRLDNDKVSFGASFGGRHHTVSVPMEAIIAIFARESGMGLTLSNFHTKREEAPAPVEEKKIDGFPFHPPLAVVAESSHPDGVPPPAPEQPSQPKVGSAAERAAARWGTPRT